MKHLLIILLFNIGLLSAQTPTAGELVKIHSVTTTEMNTISNPIEGSYAFNTTDKNMYYYDGTNWVELSASTNDVYVGAFVISGSGAVTVTGIPFQPTQVTFVAHANVESLNLNADNGIDNNALGIYNSFGTMNGFVNASSGSTIQQVIYVGSHGNSVNDISRFASSSNCIGIRYGNQNGDDLGRITGAFDSFTTDGFIINVTYIDGSVTASATSTNLRNRVLPQDVQSESIVVLYTAYR